MCTALALTTKDFYFGRNLDYEFSYGETIVIVPRNYPFFFRHDGELNHHYALMGVAHVYEGYPLFYDAINEKGLGMAGLNFVGNAHYFKPEQGKRYVAQFEFIPWVLAKASNVKEAKDLLLNANITDTPFNDKFPPSSLHYMIADKDSCIVVESMKDGLKIHDNPTGVLTNNPPFEEQLFGLNRYMGLSRKDPINQFGEDLDLKTYSRGMGALGLPGDLSSTSRFAKVAFTRANSICSSDELPSVSQFFHILHSVEQQRGVTEVKENEFEITIYSTCYNASEGICYYTSYDNHRINAVRMKEEDKMGEDLRLFSLNLKEDILFQN